MARPLRKPLPRIVETPARPFLKWAGGKTQLLPQFEDFFPPELKTAGIRRYIEPFIGGGAVFFHIARTFPVREFHLCDVNEELILLYTVVQRDVEALIARVKELESAHLRKDETQRQEHFYQTREVYNCSKGDVPWGRYVKTPCVRRAAYMLFLNRTCYNGLYRVNRNGAFNVPFGRYANPVICDEDNLRSASRLLARAAITCMDFHEIAQFAGPETFVYYDPPYRPISRTAHFTAYSRTDFSDADQQRLAAVFRAVHETGARQMLSNSDPKNVNPRDRFIETQYAGFHVNRVRASRMINSKTDARGKITECVVTNYSIPALSARRTLAGKQDAPPRVIIKKSSQ